MPAESRDNVVSLDAQRALRRPSLERDLATFRSLTLSEAAATIASSYTVPWIACTGCGRIHRSGTRCPAPA